MFAKQPSRSEIVYDDSRPKKYPLPLDVDLSAPRRAQKLKEMTEEDMEEDNVEQ